MEQQLDPKEIVIIEELAESNMFQLEILTRILVKKGIMTKGECIEEMQQLKREMDEKGNGGVMGEATYKDGKLEGTKNRSKGGLHYGWRRI